MNRYFQSRLFKIGFWLFILGCGPLLGIIILAAVGLWPDPNPSEPNWARSPRILHVLASRHLYGPRVRAGVAAIEMTVAANQRFQRAPCPRVARAHT